MNDIALARGFLQRHLALESWKGRMRDGRLRPQIAAGTVAQLVVEMPLRQQTSLLEVDQAARLEEVRAWHQSKRPMVASDSTLARSLAGFELEPVRECLWEMGKKLSERKGMKLSLPSGRLVGLGIVDGSEWGGFTASVLALAGRKATLALGYQRSAGRGHELTASRSLLRQAVEKLGRGFVDLLAVDGLYVTREDLEWAVQEGGFHLVVKSTQESLTLIQDAQQLFLASSPEARQGLEHVKGFDPKRAVEYQIFSVGGLRWGKLELPLKVAWVRESFLKPKPGHPAETTFWVITTDQTLLAEDLRELAHARWKIENGIFRQLSSLVDSKRRLTADPHVRDGLLGLWLIGLNLMSFLLAWSPMARRGCGYPTLKRTWKWFARLLVRLTLLATAPWATSDSS